jgi:hypothetical protein
MASAGLWNGIKAIITDRSQNPESRSQKSE